MNGYKSIRLTRDIVSASLGKETSLICKFIEQNVKQDVIFSDLVEFIDFRVIN